MLLAAPARFKELEAIVHPLVQDAQYAFLSNAAAAGEKLAVLENPLLLEMDGASRVDIVVVVSAGADQQRERVLARPGMTEKKFEEILARQIPDPDKRRMANFVVDTSGTIENSHDQIDKIIERLQAESGHAFESYWSDTFGP
jgi:dephospho-CoA kinase